MMRSSGAARPQEGVDALGGPRQTVDAIPAEHLASKTLKLRVEAQLEAPTTLNVMHQTEVAGEEHGLGVPQPQAVGATIEHTGSRTEMMQDPAGAAGQHIMDQADGERGRLGDRFAARVQLQHTDEL